MKRILLLALLTGAVATHAATFTVTNTASSGAGSLRQAILDSNTAGGTNTIAFAIAGGGVKTIYVEDAAENGLPAFGTPTIIDGYTQPGSSSNTLATGNNAALLIELTSTNNLNGLETQANGCLIRGLVFNGFYTAIVLGIGGQHSAVEGCFIGTDATGTNVSPRATTLGIYVPFGNNRIGGSAPWHRNVIAGCTSYGIEVYNQVSTNTTIIGNYIGTDKTGTKALPNYYGISMESPQNLIISNLVSGNTYDGIYISHNSNVVEGCYIGTDATGKTPIPNGDAYTGGLSMGGIGNRVGGATPAARNIISGNIGYGVNSRTGATNSILGNFIGVDVTGTNALPNNGVGVNVRQTSGVIVSNNVIAGNLATGVQVVQATRCKVLDNHIGTDASGTLALGNSQLGLNANSSSHFHDIAGNVIAYNGTDGFHSGIDLNNGAISNNVTGNLIHNNVGRGIDNQLTAANNRFSANELYNNGGIGIDVDGDGLPTLNDPCDTDTGDNLRQNYPVILSSTSDVSSVTIAGYLPSAASTTFTLEFFANTVCDPSGYGEGEFYIGATNVTTAANCTNNFTVTFPIAVANALLVTATATDPAGNTSEYSQCLTNVSDVVTNVAPQIACPANIGTVTTAGACDRSVAFLATATGTPTPTISYKTNGVTVTSPVTFPKGITTVNATAANVAGTNTCAFTVTILDTVLPVMNCTDYTTNLPPGASSAVVLYNATAIDVCGAVTMSCTITSGATFPAGTTPITCTAVDTAANTNTCTFNVTVNAAAPCTLSCPSQIFSNTAPGLCGATVTFSLGNCPAVVADPPSGSFFTTGVTTVFVTSNGVPFCNFPVTVTDNQPPSLTCPGTITTTNPVVNYAVTASDNCAVTSTNFSVTSGSTFHIGTTNVIVIAADAAGNTSTCSFNVVVSPAACTCPDLTGTWSNLVQTCKFKDEVPACKVKGQLLVRNTGCVDAPTSFIRYYLSDDSVQTNTFLKQVATGTIKLDRPKKRTLSAKLPAGVNGTGKFIIAVLDADHTLAECSETNNVIVFGPLP